MNNQNINIVDFEILYNILDEINENLPFNIFNYLNENQYLSYLETNKIDIKESLFLVKNIEKFYTKNLKIDKNQIFQIPNLPISIYNLIEKINIQLIKQKYNYQSKINISKYSLDINSRIISTNNNILKLTEREIDIILFLKDSKIPQKISNLQNKVWGYSTNIETHTVETHIYRLRKKINDIFNDDHFITSNDEGYFIL